MKHHLLLYILIGMFILPNFVNASEVYIPCDAQQGFYFQADKNSRIGFVTDLKIGSITELKADLLTYNPEDPSQKIPVFAVLREASWGVQPATPFYFSGQISDENKSAIAYALRNKMSKIDVQFQFVVYDFNRKNGLYYKSFHSNDIEMRGQIEKNGDGLSLSVADTPWTRVEKPKNYAFSIYILPTALKQVFYISLGPGKEVARAWSLER